MVFRDLKDGIECTTYDSTPFFSTQLIGFILGDFICKESYDLEKFNLKLRVCSTRSSDLYPETFEVLSNYIKNLVNFYQNYTKQFYPINKIDLVIVPLTEMDIIEINHVGILYLPSSNINSKLYSNDYLTKLKCKLSLVNILSKQLAKHWFYESIDFHCMKKNIEGNEVSKATLDLMKLCTNNSCFFNETKMIFDQYFDLNEKCCLFKGVINWISYLAFKSINPDFFDLVKLFILI